MITECCEGNLRQNIQKRAYAAEQTIKKFQWVPFKPGEFDCVKMAIFHLRKAGCPAKFKTPLNYKSIPSGHAMLRKMGFKSLSEYLDANFEKIAPASALVGDIIEMESEHPLGALTIYIGNGATFGWHNHTSAGRSDHRSRWRITGSNLRHRRNRLYCSGADSHETESW